MDDKQIDPLTQIAEHLQSIRSMLKFFVVLTVLFIVFGLWNFLMLVFG